MEILLDELIIDINKLRIDPINPEKKGIGDEVNILYKGSFYPMAYLTSGRITNIKKDYYVIYTVDLGVLKIKHI